MDANEHFYEACYLVWRRGGNPDRVSFESAEHDYYKGAEPDYTANKEIKRQIPPQQEEAKELAENPMYYGAQGNFQCKCGYKTTNSIEWCFHADSCGYSG